MYVRVCVYVRVFESVCVCVCTIVQLEVLDIEAHPSQRLSSEHALGLQKAAAESVLDFMDHLDAFALINQHIRVSIRSQA